MEYERQKNRIIGLKIRQKTHEYKYIDDAQTEAYIDKIKAEIKANYEKYRRTSERAEEEVCRAHSDMAQFDEAKLKRIASDSKRARVMKDIPKLEREPIDIRSYGGVFIYQLMQLNMKS